MYSEKVMDHFSNPRNVGEIPNANAVGQVGNPQCGDIMKIYMKINDDTRIIEDVKFKTFGCGAAIATSSMATELVKGKTIDEALKLTNQAVADALDGLPPIQDALFKSCGGGGTRGSCKLLRSSRYGYL